MKKLFFIFFIIFLVLTFSLSYLILVKDVNLYSSDSNPFSFSFSQKGLGAENSELSTYSPNSFTICEQTGKSPTDYTCTTTQYSGERFAEEDGEWKNIEDVSNWTKVLQNRLPPGYYIREDITDYNGINVTIGTGRDALQKSIDEVEVYKTESTRETICKGGICSLTQYSGIRFTQEEGEWKKIEDARSLKDSGIDVVIRKDSESDPTVTVKDYNYTSITYNLDSTGIVPVKHYSNKTAIRKSDNIDTKSITKDTDLKLDYEFGDEVHFGENSTTIRLDSSSVTDDTYLSQHDPSNVNGAAAFITVVNASNTMQASLIKFPNNIPQNAKIIEANLNLSLHSNALDSSDQINVTVHRTLIDWDEGVNNWLIGPNITDRTHVELNFNDKVGFNSTSEAGNKRYYWNVTRIVQNSTTLDNNDFNFYLHGYQAGAAVTEADRLIFDSKEETPSIEGPALEITFLDTQTQLSGAAVLEDTYVEELLPTTNRGTSSSLRILNETSGTTEEYHILIKFDLTSLPSDTEIVFANLSLYMTNNQMDTANERQNITSHHSTNQSWDEEQVTWNNNIAFNTTATDMFQFDGTSPTNTFIGWNVTNNIVSDLNNSRDNTTIYLLGSENSLVDNDEYIQFNSKEAATAGQRPYLNVTYTTSTLVTECGTLNIAGATYTLQNDVSSTGDCFTITGNNITLDGAGFIVNYGTSGTGDGVTTPATQQGNITIKNAIFIKGANTGASDAGIWIDAVDDYRILNNTVYTNGTGTNYGFNIVGGSKRGITANNTVFTGGSGSNSHVLRIGGGADFNNITGNNFHANPAGSGNAIDTISSSDNMLIEGNTLTTNGTSSNIGINLEAGSDNQIIRYNTIVANGTGSDSYGILMTTSANNIIDYNNITTNDASAKVIYFFRASQNNSLLGNRLTSTGSNSDGLYFDVASGLYPTGNRINETVFVSINGNDVEYIDASVNDTVYTDNIFTGSFNFDNIGTGLITFENSTHGKNLFISPISGTVTNFADKFNITNNSIAIGDSNLNVTANITLYGIGDRGFSDIAILLDGNVTCDTTTVPACSNFTALTATNVQFNVSSWSQNYSIGSSTGATPDNPPMVTLKAPSDSSLLTNETVSFNATFTDDSNLQNATLFVWNSSSGIVNQTLNNTITGLSDYINFTVVLPKADNYSWNYLASDNASQQAFASANFTFELTIPAPPDSLNPNVTDLTESPTDPATYSFGGVYEFNSTVVDDDAVNTVLFQFNITNFTASNLIGDIYNYTRTDLAAGQYDYFWYANDTTGNINNTENGTYLINKAVPTGSGIPAISNFEYPYESTYTGTESNNGDGDLVYVLHRDNLTVSNPETTTLSVGSYHYLYNVTGGQNYSSVANLDDGLLVITQNNTFVLSIDIIPSLTVTYINQTNTTGLGCPIELTCVLYRDNVTVTNNESITLAAGSYHYIYNTTGNANYSNKEVDTLLTVNQGQSALNLTLNGTQGNITVLQGDSIWLNGTLITGDSGNNLQLYKNGTLINVGVSPVQNLTTFSNLGLENITVVYPASQNYTGSSIQLWVEVLSAADTQSPQFTLIPNNISIVYPNGFSATFNATDDTALSTFFINYTEDFTINQSGYLTNFSVLSAGTYLINVSVNDTSDNINWTIFSVEVNQTKSAINLTLNGTQQNITINSGDSIWLNGTLITGDPTSPMHLYRNGSLINVGTSPVQNLTQFSNAGLENITFIYLDSQNYTTNSTTLWVDVLNVTPADTQAPQFDTIPPWLYLNYTQPLNATFNATDDVAISTFFINWSDTFIINQSGYLQNNTVLAGGFYMINVSVNDTSGLINSTVFNVTVNAIASSGNTLKLNGTEANITLTYPSQLNASASSTTNQDITLYLDGADITSDNHLLKTYYVSYKNVTAVFAANQNYTAGSIERFAEYNKGTPTGSISGLTTASYPYESTVTGSESNSADADVTYTLHLNNISTTNPNTTILGVEAWHWLYNSTEGQNWSAVPLLDNGILNITQNNTLVLGLDFSPSNSVTNSTNTTVTGQFCPAQLTCVLHRNDTIVGNPDNQILEPGNYPYVYNTTGNANYSITFVAGNLTVTLVGPPSSNIKILPITPNKVPHIRIGKRLIFP